MTKTSRKLFVFTLTWTLISLFTALGCWQLSRAQQKRLLIDSFTKRTAQTAFTATDLAEIKDWRFYRLTVTGTFDNQHSFLLDNKTYHGQVGYEVYTPFHPRHTNTTLLIDRGFIPLGQSRAQLPLIRPIEGEVTLTGMLNLPPLFMSLGALHDGIMSWPLRIEFIQLADMSSLLKDHLFPYVLLMNPKDPRAFAIDWAVVIMPPEKHQAYAVQWFALALTLLILFVALNRGK